MGHSEDWISGYGGHQSSALIVCITIMICIFGLMGNGLVIWLLGFHFRRNSFTTYILNLAAADFGSLVSLSLYLACVEPQSFNVSPLYDLFLFTCTAGLCFLTAIGLDRCLAIFFPIWYRCRRPKHLSTKLSVLIWILCGMLCAMRISFYLVYKQPLDIAAVTLFILNAWILPPLMAVFTLLLLARICCSSQRCVPENLNTVTLVSLLFFVVCRSPCIVMYSIPRLFYAYYPWLFVFSHLFFSINSSIHPVIYYLVGQRGKCCCKEYWKEMFRMVFYNEPESVDENEPIGISRTAAENC